MENTKPIWTSKTLLINLVLALSAFIPSVNVWVVGHPDIFTWVIAAVNIVLRLVTKDKLEIS